MSKKECPGCAMAVDKNEEICPICGYEFPRQSLFAKIAIWILIFLLIIWFIF